MTAYDQALRAVDALAPEDVALVLRHCLDPVPLEEWPGLLLNGRPLDEIERLVLYLVLSFLTPMEHAEVIGGLMDKLIDRWCPCCTTAETRASAAKLLRLCEWALACERGNAQWPR
jgi:hypothetical protein